MNYHLVENKILLVEPEFYHNHYGLRMNGDPEVVERFNLAAKRMFLGRSQKRLGAFWQGQDEEFLYIEFFIATSPEARELVIAAGRTLAEEIGVEFDYESRLLALLKKDQ